MSPQESYISAARALVGTPFHAGGRCPGVGVDCIGVAVVAAKACGLKHRDVTAYPLRPNGQLPRELAAQLIRAERREPGDILLMAFDDVPHHVAVYAGATIIHAYAQARKCVEQPWAKYWGDKVRGVYRFREFA